MARNAFLDARLLDAVRDLTAECQREGLVPRFPAARIVKRAGVNIWGHERAQRRLTALAKAGQLGREVRVERHKQTGNHAHAFFGGAGVVQRKIAYYTAKEG